jgi:Na+/phosphate symporter
VVQYPKSRYANLGALECAYLLLLEDIFMWIYFSLLIAILGAFVYLLSVNPKAAELGRLAFGCGLLAFLFKFAGELVR